MTLEQVKNEVRQSKMENFYVLCLEDGDFKWGPIVRGGPFSLFLGIQFNKKHKHSEKVFWQQLEKKVSKKS